MLYLWPYITFFSLPLQIPYMLNLLPPQYLPTFILRFRQAPIRNFTTTIGVLGIFCAGALAAVHLNTIVHPFTLADNRHYTFYVFRILVLKNALIKYLTAPVYIICAWAAYLALVGPVKKSVGDDNAPESQPPASKTQPPVAQDTTTTSSTTRLAIEHSGSKVTVSFLLIYLLTCTLCLITAPLVEPRYFIIPWITWRLYVPSPSSRAPVPLATTVSGAQEHGSREENDLRDDLYDYDYRLFLETFWFLIVNAVTGYMFLYRGFSWPQEPGKVQRFMW